MKTKPILKPIFTKRELSEINKLIKQGNRVCNLCRFNGGICSTGIENELYKFKIEPTIFKKNPGLYNYFDCNKAYKTLYNEISGRGCIEI
jgi:hypothetical protein